MSAEAHAYLEFYRLDLTRPTKRVLVPATTLISVGSIFACIAAARIPVGASRGQLGLTGAIIVLSGLVLGFGGMARLLAHDGFVGVTRLGLHVKDEHRDLFLPWDDIAGVIARSGGRVCVLQAGGAEVLLPRVAAPDGEPLVTRLETFRRRAAHGLAPFSRPPSLAGAAGPLR